MKRTLRNLVCFLLCLTMVIPCLPLQVWAQELQSAAQALLGQESLDEASIAYELVDQRDAYTKVFRLNDGSLLAAVYPQAVHYQGEDGMQEIDNTLQETDYKGLPYYRNTAGPMQVLMPRQAGRGPVIYQLGEKSLSFAYEGLNTLTDRVRVLSASLPEGIPAGRDDVALPQLYSGLSYDSLEGTVGLAYHLTGTALKEELILKSPYHLKTSYSFVMYTQGLTPVLEADGRVILVDGDREVLSIAAPFMTDAAGRYSQNVGVALEELADGGWRYRLTPDAEWLSQATFPVVIDPPVDQTGVDRIKDTTGVFGTNISLFNTNDEKLYLKVGNRQGYQVQAMIYGALPAVLKTGSTRIVNAQLSLAGYTGSFSSCENGLTVCAYRIIKDWNTANVEENNVLALGSDSYSDGSTVLDHVTVNDNVLADHHHVTYSLDITRAAQMWLEGTAPNYGISLRGLTNTTGNYARFIDSTNTATAALCPTFVYQYRDSVGVEDYWTFTSVEAGRGGVAAVNNFNGNLVLQQELTASTGNNAPVSVSISYSQNLASDGKKTGLGAWRTNYHMRVVALADPLEYAGRSYPYYLQDSDGTCHYFYQDGSVYRDEDGLGYQLELVDEEEFRYRIVTKDETELKFDWWGRWRKVTDSQGNYNLISYTDSTDFAIDYILEGSAASTDTRRTEFTYQSTGVTVTSPEGVSVTLGLDSAGRLAYIHYPDSTASAGRTTFTYDALGRPVSVANGWGQVTGITYNAQSQACRVSRLSWGTPGESTPLEFCAFSYAHNYTTVTDQRGQRLEYQFDTFGHTAGVVDPALGLGQRYAYGAPGGTDGEAHRLLEATDTYYASHTLVNQGFFENSTSVNGWTPYPINASFGKSWREGLGAVTSGSCLQLTKPASITVATSVNQSVSTITPGRYVLSAYVYTASPLEGTGAMVSIQAFTASGFRANNLSYPVRSTDGVWQRLQVAFTVAQGDTRLNVGVFFPGDTVGTLYVDDIQLERAPVAGAAGELNLLSSTAFVNGLSGWSLTGTGSVVTPADAPATVQNALQLTGHPLTATAARKSVAFAGQKGDSFVFGAWAKGNSIGLAGSEQYKAGTPGFGLFLELLDANGTVVQQTPVTGFNPAIDSWQFAHGSCVAEKSFSQVRLTLSYAYNASAAQFALPFVYADAYSQTYAYDAQGNLTDAVSLSQSQSAYAYQDDRLTSSLSPTGSRFLYDYKLNSPQIYSAFSNGGQRTYHVYNTTGDLTQFTVVDTPVLTSPRKEGGTVRATFINADGGRSLFAYTLTTGYPVYCTPSYGWNAMKWDLVSASATDDTLYVLRNVAQPGLALTANAAGTSYTVSTYTAGSPANAQIFRLEAWGDGTFRLLSAASGYTKCLAEAPQRFHYQGSTNRLLVSQDSTDTDLSARWYLVDADSQHRMVASATYSQDGNYLLSATDEAGHTTTYTYNAQGLTQTVTDPNGNVTGYTYDAMGRTLSASLDGAKVEYTYAQDQLSQVEVDDTVSYRFSYDAYGRRREIRLEGVDDPVLATYAYAGNDLASLTYTNGVSVNYTYDSYGRLIGKTFSDSQEGVQYVYDAQGRLWRSRDSLSLQTAFFEYDRLGRNVSASLTNHALDQVLATRQLRYNDQKNTLSQSLVRLYADHSQLVQYQYTYGDPALGQIPDALVQMIVDGRWVSFAYDRLGRLSQRSLAFAGTTKSQSYTYQTNAQGNDTTRIATYTDLLGTTHTYTYDANGNVLTDSYSGLTYSYEYDSQDRLVRVNDPVQNLTQTYTYDDRGNCTRRDTYAYTTGALGTGTAQLYGYGYQAWPDALTWAGGELLSYTGGNPNDWTQNRSFAWTGGRNLQSVYQNDTLLALYNYDSAGLRVFKLTGTGSTQYYILDSQYQGQVSTINGQSYTVSYYWDEAGAPMGVKINGSAYFFVKNLQGDVVAITDYQGNVAARYTYDVWGKLLSVVNGAGNPVTDPTHVANLNPFRYRGYFYDAETGFYYLSSRYYDPEVGRFINSDDPGLVEMSEDSPHWDKNLFAYCDNNPVTRMDDGGEFWHMVVGAVIGGLVGGISSIVGQAVSGKKINWAEVGVSAASGAVTGAITAACPGMGAVATGVVNGAVGAGTHVATELVNGRTPTVAGTLAAGVTSGVLAGGLKAVGNSIAKPKVSPKVGTPFKGVGTSQIGVDPNSLKLSPSFTPNPDKYTAALNRIRQNGMYGVIDVARNGLVFNGQHRVLIARQLGIAVDVIIR